MNGYRVMRWVVVAALSAGALALAACGDDDGGASGGSATTSTPVKNVPFSSPEESVPDAYPPPTPKALTVGILNPTSSSEVLTNMWDAAEREAKRLGGKVIIKSAELNPDTQISQFEQLLNENVDAIILTPIADPRAIAPLVQQAAQKKIPVVAPLEITPGQAVPVPGFATQIWHRRDKLTYLQVQEAAKQLPPGAEIGIISFALPVPIFKYTVARQKYWAKKFGLKVVDDVAARTDTTPDGEKAATTILSRNPNVKGIFGFLDEPAIGAALAARAAGKTDVKTFGLVGGSLGRTGLDNGRISATVFVDASDVGTKSMQAAYDAAEGKKLPPVVIAGDPVVITKDTLDKAPPVEGTS